MKTDLIRLSRRYGTALREHLKQGPRASFESARGLGREAVAMGLETLEVARIHEGAVAALKASSQRTGFIRRAERFFAAAITPIENTHHDAVKTNARLSELNQGLRRRAVDMAASNRALREGITLRETAETELRQGEKQRAKLLRESIHRQEHLRHLTHQTLSAQEVERRKLSCELHDEIAQSLLGINVGLLSVKEAARRSPANLKKEIAHTQRLVEQSVQSINRFARELNLQ